MADEMSNAERLFLEYEGHIVPRAFNPGFVTLSYVVSLIGALSTLELINRRTAPKGKFNHLMLVSSAVTMGGIAIWSMHFIGSRAIDLAHGEADLQIAYSSGFTALSFFVPIVFLIIAFVAIGTEDTVSWWRVVGGGVLTGIAVCGMHYLGNASVANYKCEYHIVNVIGAAIIAVAASNVALFMFFVFRAAWANAWWKRLATGVVLAGAVSGMHWCAATGTNYRLLKIQGAGSVLSRNATVIVVICLSVGACFVMAGTAIYTARMRRRYANKAQQVVLAAAVFDKNGRILVSPDGLLPSEIVTDTFLEKSSGESFSTAHRLFHWMFQASRNWSGIMPLMDGISNHINHLPRQGRDRDARMSIKLVSEHGEVIDKYDVIFRELFCVAALALSEKLKDDLSNVGVLWDEILPTGTGSVDAKPSMNKAASEADSIDAKKSPNVQMTDMEKGLESGKEDYGRGSLMFLVRMVEGDRDMENLGAAGYRFAPLHQVSGIIGSSMQIKAQNVESKLRDLNKYAEAGTRLLPGVQVGLFAIRARVGTMGFDVLVRKDARNLLPTIRLPLAKLEGWQVEFLKRMDTMSVFAIEKKVPAWRNVSNKERIFATQVVTAMRNLRTWVGDPVFNDATFTARVFDLPCRNEDDNGPTINSLLVVKLVIPIHVNVVSSNCEFIPLNFFKVHQLSCKFSPHHMAFVRSVHRELAPIVNAVPVPTRKTSKAQRRRASLADAKLPSWIRKPRKGGRNAVDSEGNPIPTIFGRTGTTLSNQSSSTLKLWDRRSSEPQEPATPSYDRSPYAEQPSLAAALGGIMVSQEITVNVQDVSDPMPAGPASEAGQGGRNVLRKPSHAALTLPGNDDGIFPGHGAPDSLGIELGTLHTNMVTQIAKIGAEDLSEVVTFVDELFSVCINNR